MIEGRRTCLPVFVTVEERHGELVDLVLMAWLHDRRMFARVVRVLGILVSL